MAPSACAHLSRPSKYARSPVSALLLSMVAVTACGCGLASNLMHGLGVDMVPAEYEGLEDRRVAVVTVTDSSQYTKDAAALELNTRVGEVLFREVDDVVLVRDDEIQKWRDLNGYDSTGFTDVGKGVEADKVLGIEVSDLQLHDGPTLYRGRCNVVIQVIDVETGDVEYKRTLDEFTFPSVAGQSTSETSEARFRRLYLTMLAEEIGRSFHPYDVTDRFALDSKIAGYR